MRWLVKLNPGFDTFTGKWCFLHSVKDRLADFHSKIGIVAKRFKEEFPKVEFDIVPFDNRRFGEYMFRGTAEHAGFLATLCEVISVLPAGCLLTYCNITLDLETPEARLEWRKNMVTMIHENLLISDFEGFKNQGEQLICRCTFRVADLIASAQHVLAVEPLPAHRSSKTKVAV
jgi:hypothetical protein